MAFARIQEGSIGDDANIRVHRHQLVKNIVTINTSNGAIANSPSYFDQGRYHWSLSAEGRWYKSGFVKPIGTAATGTPLTDLVRVVLVKQVPLTDRTVAGTANGQRDFCPGRPVFQGSFVGYLDDSVTPVVDGTLTTSNFTIPLGGSDSVAGATAVLQNIRQVQDHVRGGCVLCTGNFFLSGTITHTGSHPFDDEDFTADISDSNGKDVNGDVLIQQLRMDINYMSGAAPVVSFSGPFNGAVTVGDTA